MSAGWIVGRILTSTVFIALFASAISAKEACDLHLRKIDVVAKNSEITESVIRLISQLKRKPTDIEIDNAIVGSVDKWKGSGMFGVRSFRKGRERPPGRKSHLRLNDSPERAWQPVLDRLKNFESLGLSEREAKLTIAAIQSEIRTSWSIEVLQEWADQEIVLFLMAHGRTPIENKKKGIHEVEDLGVSYDQWTGTSSYKGGSNLRAYAMHPSASAAWISVHEKLNKLEPSANRETALRLVEAQIAAAQNRELNKLNKSIIELYGVSDPVAAMPELLAYIKRRADYAAETDDERSLVEKDLVLKADAFIRQSAFFGNRVSEQELIDRFKTNAIYLHPLEQARIVEYYDGLVPYLKVAYGFKIRAAELASSSDLDDFLRGVIAETLLPQILNANFDRTQNDVNSARAKFTFAAFNVKRRIIDKMRRRFASTRTNGQRELTLEEESLGSIISGPTVRWSDEPTLDDMLVGLNPEQASLLRDMYGLGLTLTQIEVRTGIPLGTLKSTLSRSLAKLRERLGPSFEDSKK